MSEDWQYTEEPVGDPHALCCSRCKADREALITTRQALADMVSDADATQGALDQHSGQGRMAALASLGNRLADAARQILAATDTTTNEKENDQ